MGEEKFSSLKGNDLLELLTEVDNSKLEYRSSLNLDKDTTFGVEIEYERWPRFLTKRFVNNNLLLWESTFDESLSFGGEVDSPILTDDIKYWESLKIICNYLKQRKVVTTNNAGGHIHVGAHILKGDHNYWRKFIKLYATYEHVLFRFLYGDKITARKSLIKYARPISNKVFMNIKLINEAKDMNEIRSAIPAKDRYQSINFNNINFLKSSLKAYRNTVEFRSPNSSVDEVIIQNNINALTKLINSVKDSDFDEEFIDYKIEHSDISSQKRYVMYNEICLKDSLELVDLIFDNNEDKIYFLKQYLKEFEEIENVYVAVKSKKLTK